MTLHLYNTLTRTKEEFKPLAETVRMYVCGPTVYDRAHLGNARSVVVYDVLYRLLRHAYGEDHVKYVRNITDVDDKINAAAKARGISIQQLTQEVTGWFHEDMGALNVLPPIKEPKATEHIQNMIEMIDRMVKRNVAYVSQGHVLFSVASCPRKDSGKYYYGQLSGRVQEDLEAGARVKVESYKRDASDFVLWKPADKDDDASSVFDSPWGKGRPGWHIECSAMSIQYLGKDFDIHGGGADLMFPHHENEIAQSCGTYPESRFARYWVHNGFLTVNGEKMSKSLGNFITVRDLLNKHPGNVAQRAEGENIRLALLSTKYNEPLDWKEKLQQDAKSALDKWYRQTEPYLSQGGYEIPETQNMKEFIDALCDDLNTPKALSIMHNSEAKELYAMGRLLGFFSMSLQGRLKGMETITASSSLPFETIDPGIAAIQAQIDARIVAKKAKNWAEADRIRNELKAQSIILEDRPDGTTDWRRE